MGHEELLLIAGVYFCQLKKCTPFPTLGELLCPGAGSAPYIFAPCFLGAKLGAKSRPLQSVPNQQVPDFLGCRGAWSGVGVQQTAFESLASTDDILCLWIRVSHLAMMGRARYYA